MKVLILGIKKNCPFCDYIISNDFDLVAETDTWLGTSIDNARIIELLPSGYQFKHVPRSIRSHGGSFALVFKTSMNFCLVFFL